MSDITIDADAFGKTIEEILSKLNMNVEQCTPEAVQTSLKEGEKQWKQNARSSLSSSYTVGGWGKEGYGKTIKTGKYARSIKSHLISSKGQLVDGEIGSPSMPGLPHLLEKGHALVGGGSVGGIEHIAPAADEAFKKLEEELEKGIEEAISEV